MAYQAGQTSCPQCGSGEQVRTVRELFDTMNSAYEQQMQRAGQLGQPGFGQPGGPGSMQGSDDDDYDHYNVEGSDSRRGIGGWGGRRSSRGGNDFGFGAGSDFGSDIAGAAASAAFGFAGRAIGKRIQRAFEEKVVPAMQARTAQAQQNWQQSKADQEAIVARYPELRACLKDNVVFLDGGYRTVPIKDIKMPFTMDSADALVARLR
jgi:hypothetical protein